MHAPPVPAGVPVPGRNLSRSGKPFAHHRNRSWCECRRPPRGWAKIESTGTNGPVSRQRKRRRCEANRRVRHSKSKWQFTAPPRRRTGRTARSCGAQASSACLVRRRSKGSMASRRQTISRTESSTCSQNEVVTLTLPSIRPAKKVHYCAAKKHTCSRKSQSPSGSFETQ